MTTLFGNARRQDDIIPESDVLGGFQRKESGIHDFTVEMAYAVVAESGAKGVALTLMDSTGQPYRETLYVTSGTEKGGNNFYTDRNGKKQYLMGFTLANDLCIAITKKELADARTEEKDVKVQVWNDGVPSDEVQKKHVLMDLLGGRVSLGILKVSEDGYPDTSVSRERNTIDKVFTYGTRLTIVEVEAGLSEGVFADKWSERNEGKLIDRRNVSKTSNTATAGAPKEAQKATTSLFT